MVLPEHWFRWTSRPQAAFSTGWPCVKSEGCHVQFRDVQRLVAAFFSVIGINRHARVVPRPVRTCNRGMEADWNPWKVITARPFSACDAPAQGMSVAIGGDGQGYVERHYGSRALVPTKSASSTTVRCWQGFAAPLRGTFTLFGALKPGWRNTRASDPRGGRDSPKDWRTDRVLRRLEAMLAVADLEHSLIITGKRRVLEPRHGIVAIGSRWRLCPRPQPGPCCTLHGPVCYGVVKEIPGNRR